MKPFKTDNFRLGFQLSNHGDAQGMTLLSATVMVVGNDHVSGRKHVVLQSVAYRLHSLYEEQIVPLHQVPSGHNDSGSHLFPCREPRRYVVTVIEIEKQRDRVSYGRIMSSGLVPPLMPKMAPGKKAPTSYL
jgi:hypothetical protein